LSVLLSGIYEEEVMEGLGSLGEPVTGAAIAAASSAMALIAGLIKQIGGLKKDGKEAPSGEEGSSSESVDVDAGSDSGSSSGSSNKMALRTTDGSTDSSSSGSGGFMDKAKTWVKEHPVQAGAAALLTGTAVYIGLKRISKKKNKSNGLSGVYQKKRKKGKSKSKVKHHKSPIALL
jgi:hypothetical protein